MDRLEIDLMVQRIQRGQQSVGSAELRADVPYLRGQDWFGGAWRRNPRGSGDRSVLSWHGRGARLGTASWRCGRRSTQRGWLRLRFGSTEGRSHPLRRPGNRRLCFRRKKSIKIGRCEWIRAGRTGNRRAGTSSREGEVVPAREEILRETRFRRGKGTRRSDPPRVRDEDIFVLRRERNEGPRFRGGIRRLGHRPDQLCA